MSEELDIDTAMLSEHPEFTENVGLEILDKEPIPQDLSITMVGGRQVLAALERHSL